MDVEHRRVRDVEVYRFVAEFSRVVDCGHEASEGDVLVRMVDERIICEACAP